jgi:hypothetical protein
LILSECFKEEESAGNPIYALVFLAGCGTVIHPQLDRRTSPFFFFLK